MCCSSFSQTSKFVLLCDFLVLTKDEAIERLVWQELIDEKAFRSRTTASQQPDQVFVLHTAYNVNFIVEICCSVSVVEEKPFHSNLSPIM